MENKFWHIKIFFKVWSSFITDAHNLNVNILFNNFNEKLNFKTPLGTISLSNMGRDNLLMARTSYSAWDGAIYPIYKFENLFLISFVRVLDYFLLLSFVLRTPYHK